MGNKTAVKQISILYAIFHKMFDDNWRGHKEAIRNSQVKQIDQFSVVRLLQNSAWKKSPEMGTQELNRTFSFSLLKL